MFEFSDVPQDMAEEAFRKVSAKLPIKVRLVKAGGMSV